jgi:uncharacterized membrane protein YozB (DUF420 family)
MDVRDLPTVNACLNSLATGLLTYGYILIRRGEKERHQKVMLSAFAVSVLFLICYLIYHYHVGSVKYPGTGALRLAYLSILLTHVVLAALVPFLALRTLYLASKKRFDQHRKIARITWPIWMYVSVTGVVVYLMLYVFPPTV